MSVVERMVYARRWPVIGRVFDAVLRLYGFEIPLSVDVGAGLQVAHRARGTVIHPNTTIGARVRIYHGVTIGRRSAYREGELGHVYIGDDAMLCPGSVVLCDEGTLTVAEGTVLGANAVLTQSTGPWEIWGGLPAKKLSDRPRE